MQTNRWHNPRPYHKVARRNDIHVGLQIFYD